VTPFASVRSLTVRHIGRKRPALRDLDLDWREGERLLLLGPSGSGKSTLALCLDGVIPHGIDAHWESGGVSVDGRDTRAASLAELAATVGVLFQDPETQLVMLETDDEIAFGLENLGLSREEMRTRIAEARAATGLGPSTPRRLDQLSGGTKQRVSLAALLAMRPRALVLDEPTANLDVHAETELFDQFLSHARGSTTIVVSHRFSTVRRARRIVVIADGHVTEDGGHDSLLAADGTYSRLYRLQADRFGWSPPTEDAP